MRKLWRLCSKPPWSRINLFKTASPRWPKGEWPKIVRQRDGLGQVLIQAQGAGQAAGHGGHFDGVGQPRAQMIARAVEENLRLVFQPAKGARMDDAVAVALIFSAPQRRRLRDDATAGFAAQLRVGRQDLPLPLLKFFLGTRHGRDSVGQQFLHGNAAQFKQAPDRVLDQVVGTGRAGGDADGDLARRQPAAVSTSFCCSRL
jgi:hypothetical protein